MKRFLFFLFLFLLALFDVYLFVPQITTSLALPSIRPTPTVTITPTPMPSLLPVTIIIPKLKINTIIEHVGTTPTGAMDVPKNAGNAGWYRGSAKPGQWGDAVISGHYDTPSGKPAIFYFLRKLSKGDEIQVISTDGIVTTFVVTGVDTLPYTQIPKEFVFNSNTGVNLNLITCDGIWSPVDKNYNKRLIVYSTLKI